jgi:hypothetical protein
MDPFSVVWLRIREAYSNKGHDLAVSLLKHCVPYANYGLLNYSFDLTASWSVYSVEFTTWGLPGGVQDGRLMFWFSPFATDGD